MVKCKNCDHFYQTDPDQGQGLCLVKLPPWLAAPFKDDEPHITREDDECVLGVEK